MVVSRASEVGVELPLMFSLALGVLGNKRHGAVACEDPHASNV